MPPDTINILFNHLGLWQKENTFPSISWFLHFLNNLQSTQGCCPGCFKWNRWKKLRFPKFIKKWCFRKNFFSQNSGKAGVQFFWEKKNLYESLLKSKLLASCARLNWTIKSYFSTVKILFWLRPLSHKWFNRNEVETPKKSDFI